MHNALPALEPLIEQLNKLPGIGKKSAQRLALFILKKGSVYAEMLVDAIVHTTQDIHFCKRCFNLTEQEYCNICNDTKRDSHKICVVEDVVDVMAIESAGEFDGLYHVLGGVISPLAGVLPADLKINELLRRVDEEDIAEVLLALNLSTEGEATMIYLSQFLKEKGIEVTQIAYGIPMGSQLEFIDQTTIGRAIASRQKL